MICFVTVIHRHGFLAIEAHSGQNSSPGKLEEGLRYVAKGA
jgi:hypothetical protein